MGSILSIRMVKYIDSSLYHSPRLLVSINGNLANNSFMEQAVTNLSKIDDYKYTKMEIRDINVAKINLDLTAYLRDEAINKILS